MLLYAAAEPVQMRMEGSSQGDFYSQDFSNNYFNVGGKCGEVAALPVHALLTSSLCRVLVVWSRYERWFDLDIRP